MFVLSEIRTLIRLLPRGFDRSLEDQLTDEINRKLANKVLINVGLCLSIHDIVEIGESFLFPGDGASHTKVRFRMLVFRPHMEEVLIGKIKSCSKEGVHVSLEFFDDILIPAESLQHPSRFDETESEYPTEEDEHHDLFMDPGEQIRIRVVSEQFVDTGPTKPKITESEQKEEVRTPPYSLVGTINEPGLGLLSWWNS